MLNHRSTKTYRLNGRLYMRGTASNSGSVRFKANKGSLRSFGTKIHNFLKKIGPKIVHGGKKLLDFVASDPTVRSLISSTANQLIENSGDSVNKIISTANNMVKNKKIDSDSVKDIVNSSKDLITKWKDNNRKVQASNAIKPETKAQVQENTDKLVEAAGKGRLGTIGKLKNVSYLNLLTKSSRGGSISPSASVVKEIRDALGLPTTSIAAKGRMFLGDLKPRYLVSQIIGDDTNFKAKPTKKGKIDKTAQFQDKKTHTVPDVSDTKGDIVKRFEALF